MKPGPYQALVLDLDGTLVGRDQTIHPTTLRRLREAIARGVAVMIATGRSESATLPVLRELGLDCPAVVYNGAALYCPVEDRLIRVHTLTPSAADAILDLAAQNSVLAVVMTPGAKYALAPRNSVERDLLADFADMNFVERSALRQRDTIRITLVSGAHPSSGDFARWVESRIEHPVFITHLPLTLIPKFSYSPLMIVDVQPPCDGKAEAFGVLNERCGVTPERTVAVGDADNDRLLLERAGLAVAMGNAVEELRAIAHRTIGDCNTDALGQLVAELFLYD